MKKIRFPLEMADGKMVRELEELQENFDLERALEYFNNGKLLKWLENNYNDDISEELEELTGNEEDFIERFMDALGVEVQESSVDVKRILEKARLKEKLKRLFPEEEAEQMADSCADTQELLEKLITEGKKEIYLVEGTYRIPGYAREICFKGIKEPEVEIEEKDPKKYMEQRLQFLQVLPADEESRKMMNLDDTSCILQEFLKLLQLQLEQI